MKDYKLKLDSSESKEILQIFVLMNKHAEIDKLLKNIQPHMVGLKEKVNDVGGEVTYDEL